MEAALETARQNASLQQLLVAGGLGRGDWGCMHQQAGGKDLEMLGAEMQQDSRGAGYPKEANQQHVTVGCEGQLERGAHPESKINSLVRAGLKSKSIPAKLKMPVYSAKMVQALFTKNSVCTLIM
jgi:hypothetical protein